MGDILTIIAALEWTILAIITFICLRKWNKKFSSLYNKLHDEIYNSFDEDEDKNE